MELELYAKKTEEYLAVSDVIDYDNRQIAELSDCLADKANDETDYIRLTYEFVRDRISHSADIHKDTVTCSASEVLTEGHGICFAKSHLLAALLRGKSVPAGFCYQKLILDDDAEPVLIYHGLNAVRLKKYDKWVRLDARGNKNGINAQFGIDKEQLAFQVRTESGEKDIPVIYPEPDRNVLEKLRTYKTREELCKDLPTKLFCQES